MKRIGMFISVCILTSMCFTFYGAAQETPKTFSVSGDLTAAKPTMEQLEAEYEKIVEASSVYETQPSVVSPYQIGKLTDGILQSGLSDLNYYRYAAGLPLVELSQELNENAQYGAVLLAAINTLTHYPEQPVDMSDDFYEQGSAATRTSNISWRSWSADGNILISMIDGQMRDRGESNYLSMGHRRWILNPTLKYVGMGCADGEYGSYSVLKVFDTSGSNVDYNFVSWPPSGNALSDTFGETYAWNITVNPQKFMTPNIEDVEVTMTRLYDGEQTVLNILTGTSGAQSDYGEYFTINTSRYGCAGNSIIFRPEHGFNKNAGEYQVKVTGLKTIDGQDAQLVYNVNFSDCVNVGDVNRDGIINSTDFMQVRRHYLNLYTIPNEYLNAADVNDDGSINSTDFMQIRRHFLGLYVIGELI